MRSDYLKYRSGHFTPWFKIFTRLNRINVTIQKVTFKVVSHPDEHLLVIPFSSSIPLFPIFHLKWTLHPHLSSPLCSGSHYSLASSWEALQQHDRFSMLTILHISAGLPPLPGAAWCPSHKLSALLFKSHSAVFTALVKPCLCLQHEAPWGHKLCLIHIYLPSCT